MNYKNKTKYTAPELELVRVGGAINTLTTLSVFLDLDEWGAGDGSSSMSDDADSFDFGNS